MFRLSDVEACEPTMLRLDPDVHVVEYHGARSMCPLVTLYSESRELMAAYLRDQWGSDEDTGGWTSEAVAGIEECDPPAPTWWLIRHAFTGETLAEVEAVFALDALSEYAVAEGFVPYADLIREQPTEDGEGQWAHYTEEVEVCGIFTNYSIKAVSKWEAGLE